MTNYAEWIGQFVPENVSALDRARMATAAEDARAAKRAETAQRNREAQAEQVAVAARHLGIEPGETTRAALRVGEQETIVAGLREKLAKEERKLAAARKDFDHVQRTMAQLAEATGGRVKDVPGELAASRHMRQVAADVQRGGWWQ